MLGFLDAMLGPYLCHVELMLSQERAQKEHVVFGSCRAMLGLYGAYVGPMLIHVRRLEAMFCHICAMLIELMLSQERRVPF